jgi:hypothetical protein
VTPFGRRVPATYRLLQRIPLESFDGNLTDQIANWLLPAPGFVEVTERGFELLWEMTVDEHNLGWVVFPPAGYRL